MIKTYQPTQKDLEKKWYLVDVKGKVLGHIATKIANMLRGKNKPFFTQARDCGDYIVVVNAEKVAMTANKVNTKLYISHTGYRGAVKTKTARQMFQKHPEQIVYNAVYGMLPRNKMRHHIIKNLKIFTGNQHTHTAQKPVSITL